MADDPQDKPARKNRRRSSAAISVLPVGLGRQASAPRVEPWGLVVELQRPVAAPVLLSRPQAARLGRALVQTLYPGQAQRDALARAGHVLALADGLMGLDTFLTDVDVQLELQEIAAYLARVLPPAPRQDETRTPWMTLADCFHATDRSDDMAAFATGLYDEAHARSLCLPFFRAHFEHQGPEADPFVGVFADAAYQPRSKKLDAALAHALGVEVADLRKVALVALPRAGTAYPGGPDEEETSLEFGKPGYEDELFALAVRDKHELDACAPGKELARALQAMRAQAADEQATQFGWRGHVPVAVQPSGDVLLGFATVDEMGGAMREALEGQDTAGERLALRWQHWLMDHYIPLLQETFDAGCRTLAFSAPAATLPRESRAGLPGVRRELPALEAVVVEHSRHAHGDVSTGVRAQAWRCLALPAGTPGEKNVMNAFRGNAFLLCVVLVVLDQDDHPVQQLNFFHTTPFAADTLKDSAEHYAEHMRLPLEWRYSLLHVDDDELRLTALEAHELQVNAPDAARQALHRRDH
jgi:hypothetical protein